MPLVFAHSRTHTQMPILGGQQHLPLGKCEIPPPGSLHLAGSVLTECMP